MIRIVQLPCLAKVRYNSDMIMAAKQTLAISKFDLEQKLTGACLENGICKGMRRRPEIRHMVMSLGYL